VQREIGEEIRSSAFAVSETLNQVSNVAGSLVGVLVSMLNNGQVALAIPAAGLTVALVTIVARRRRRILVQRTRARGARGARGVWGDGQSPQPGGHRGVPPGG
jgi:preprotein translocase subunit SecY